MEIDTGSILNKIEKLMSLPFTDETFKSIVALENELSDAVTEQCNTGSDIAQSFLYRGSDTREGFILTRLGHLSANPSDSDRTDLIKNVYVYSNKKSKTDPNYYPNATELTEEAFIMQLIQASRQEGMLYNGEITSLPDVPKDVFILCGRRGSGKTFFLNHCFSKHHDLLNREKVIWIRIDLAGEFGGKKPDIVHWMRSKICLVILRYYLQKPDFQGLISQIESYISQTFPQNVQPYLENLNTILEQFRDRELPEALHERLVNSTIARQITKVVLKMGYSFIFVLDGFDKVDITPQFIEKFEFVRSVINELTRPDVRHGGCFLIVTRIETIQFFGGASYPVATTKTRNPILREISETPFDQIVERRIECLKTRIASRAAKFSWSLADWPAHIEEFETHLFLTSEAENRTEFSKQMQFFFYFNHRAKVQFIQLTYHDFLEYKKFPKRYKLIEAMCKGGFKYPPRYFYYEFIDRKLRPQHQLKVFDNVFMPTLFRFPYASGAEWYSLPACQTYLLAPLRISQALYSRAELEKVKDKEFSMSVNNLTDILHEVYGYDSHIIHLILEEFADYGFIQLVSGAILNSSQIQTMRIIPTPKLGFVFGMSRKKSFINNIAYLNMCAMRMLIGKSALQEKSGRIPLMKALSLEDNDTTVYEWAMWKIMNAISVYRVIAKLDSMEQTAIRDSPKIRTAAQQITYIPVQHFVADMKESVLNQVRLLVEEMTPDYQSEFVTLLNEYEKRWCS